MLAAFVEREGMHVNFVPGLISKYEHPSFGVRATDGCVPAASQQLPQVRHVRVSDGDVEVVVSPGLFADQRVDAPASIQPDLDSVLTEKFIQREHLFEFHHNRLAPLSAGPVVSGTGKPLRYTSMVIVTFDDIGLVSEVRSYFDFIDIVRQVGLAEPWSDAPGRVARRCVRRRLTRHGCTEWDSTSITCTRDGFKMTSPADQIRYQARALHDLIGGVQADQWSNATPCAKWSVRDLVNHLVGGGTMFAASFRGETLEVPDGGMPDMLGEDATGAWDKVIAEFESAVSQPGAMDNEVVLPFATLPAQVALDIASFDLLVHAWDLAQATGQSFDPPDDVVAGGRQVAEALVGGLRDGDTFADAAAAGDGASSIEQLAAFCGRSI